MNRTLLVLTIVIDLAVIGIWFALGPHFGWSMTQVPVKKIDPVTEIEFTEYDHRFVPGVDFLAAGLIGSGTLFAFGLIFTKFTAKPKS
jgi:hypothetical protein